MATPYVPRRPATRWPYDPWFDLAAGRGQNSASWQFELIEAASGRLLGELTPVRDSPPTLAHDTTRAVVRQLTLALGARDAAAFDAIAHRVRVVMVTGDGRRWPLGGRMMATDDTQAPATSGATRSVVLADEALAVLGQPIDRAFTAQLPGANPIALGQPAGTVAAAFLRRYPLFDPDGADGARTTGVAMSRRAVVPVAIEPTVHVSEGAWTAGTAGSQVLAALAADGDYLPPWIDNTGVLRMVRSFDPAGRVPAVDWDTSGRVHRDSIARTSDVLSAPNRYVVISNSGAEDTRTQPVTGAYDVPASAPWSIARRGYVVPRVTTMQVSTIEQAAAIARTQALLAQAAEQVELTTPPDPRHDAYDVIRWDGQLWLETAWSMVLAPGGAMRHTLRRAYR